MSTPPELREGRTAHGHGQRVELGSELAVLEFDFSSRGAAGSADAGDGDHVERVPAPAPGGGAEEWDSAFVHVVHGGADVFPVSGGSGQRRFADVLLPAD